MFTKSVLKLKEYLTCLKLNLENKINNNIFTKISKY